MRPFLLPVILLSLSASSFAQVAPEPPKVQSSALINQQLDQQVALELNGALPKVMTDIADKTGVRIEYDPAIWELLPWGRNTTITATIKNQTLREALTAMTRKLGLRFVLRDEAIELQPMPGLQRLGRRATVQELQALDLLASTPANLGTSELPAKTLIESIDNRLREIKTALAVENRTGTTLPPDQRIAVPRNATLMEALEELPKQARVAWYPWDNTLVILPKEQIVLERLSRKVTVRFNGVPIEQVLPELAQLSGVEFSVEPGAIQRIPGEFRTIRLFLSDGTIKEALEAIAGVTGLAYTTSDSGIYLWNQRPGASAAGRIVFFLPLPDIGAIIPVRETEISPDLREYVQSHAAKELDKLRAMMKEEGFRPTTKPTQPSDEHL